jgi:predicted transcriptional regulator of viral defense system
MDNMSISKQVKRVIDTMNPGSIFGLNDFSKFNNAQAVSLELSRLFKKGEIQRITKGKYYVPKNSRFGKLGPSEWEILERLVIESGGYFAGPTALNRIGATTQIPSTVTIRGARSTRTLNIGSLIVKFYKSGNEMASLKQAKLTDILETLRLIKRTPDGSVEKTIAIVKANLKGLNKEDQHLVIKLSMRERPYVRALLGALLEDIGTKKIDAMKIGLNALSKYKIGISKKDLPNQAKWGII